MGGWVGQWVNGWVSEITNNLMNLDIIETIQFIICRDTPTHGWVHGLLLGWVVQWVNGWGQIILLNIK